MLLAIDVGNTNTVFAIFDQEKFLHSWRCQTDGVRSADEYAIFLSQLFNLNKIEWIHIKNIIVSSVVPDTNFNIDRLCQKYFGCSPLFIDSTNTNLKIDLDNASEVGADRIVNAVAVISYYKTPAIVVDFGTATTFDVIDKNGVYKGGVIAPGVRLSIEALTKRAAKLPQINIEEPKHIIGKNTLEAMQSGMYWGYISMIEGILSRMQNELKEKPYVIATGGLASLYAQNTKVIDIVDDHLILKGLNFIYKSNNEKN